VEGGEAIETPRFVLATCQVGAEAALKNEIARRWPDFRVAYSRPGFLTFKLPEGVWLRPEFDLEAVFARSHAFSLGKASGASPDDLAAQAWALAASRPVERVHGWSRDSVWPAREDGEARAATAIQAMREALRTHCPRPEMLAADATGPNRAAQPGEYVLDCVLVQQDEWWVGWHRVHSVPSQWPGGMIELKLPSDAVSRAWLKMEESLEWLQWPIPPGARVAELGSAPGGASQALLGRGMNVLGIDPAEMDPRVLGHPNFVHLRRRIPQVRRRDFRKIRWLTVDMNVAPAYTLEAVEAIVTHPEVNIRGLILTLKLPQWELADHVPEYLERVRGWGYNEVGARQLQHNRQEICLAGLMRPFVRKPFKPGQR
jgi:23S rRNA (cytidine2498-2'-O)-methyltransferase